MGIYILFIIIISIIITINKFEKKNKFGFFDFLLLLILALFSGLRYGVGWDYWVYYNIIYSQYFYPLTESGEIINILLMNIIENIGEPQIYFFLNSFVTVFLIGHIIKRYSKNFNISIIFFVFFPFFYLNSLSVVRNFTAIALVFYSSKFIIERKFFKFCSIILIASLIHSSAIICILFYFIYKYDFKKTHIIFAIPFSLIIRYFTIYILTIFDSRYLTYIVSDQNIEGRFSLIVYLVILTVVFLFKKKIIVDNPINKLYVNQFIIGVFLFLTFINLGPLASRFSIYLTLSVVIFFPSLLNIFVDNKTTQFLKLIFTIVMMSFFIYTIINGSETYLPYETIFSR